MTSLRELASLLSAILLLGACGCSQPNAPLPDDMPPAVSASAASLPQNSHVWLENVAQQAGIDFVHDSGHRDKFYIPEIVSGGVALLDYDNDGNLDLYLVQSGCLTEVPAARPPNQLYRNLGNGNFENVTEQSGTNDRGYGMGVATGDYDKDGDIDLYVVNLGHNTLLRNEGDGTFSDVTTEAGVGDKGFGSSAAFVDYDHDGDLDLFTLNYLVWSVETAKDCFNVLGQPDYCSPAAYNAPAIDVLYRNESDGTFTDVTAVAGIDAAFGTGLGVVCGDFSGDGRVDLFVANDGRNDQLWVNLGDGRFEDQGLLRGCAIDQEGQAKAGMGVTAEDVDGDGDLDLLVCNLNRESDSFFVNEGDFFRDSTARAGLAMTSRGFTRFGMAWVDLDNDGWLDLYQANGRVATEAETPDPDDPFAERNLLYRGQPGGKFQPVTPPGGTEPLLVHTSRAAAFGDLDNDGGVDIVVANRDAAPYVLRNVVPQRGNWLIVRALDEHGCDAIGATLVLRGGETTIRRDVRTAYSYCSANDPRVHFGLGRHSSVDALQVTWIDGTRESFAVPGVNQVLVVRAGQSEEARLKQ